MIVKITVIVIIIVGVPSVIYASIISSRIPNRLTISTSCEKTKLSTLHGALFSADNIKCTRLFLLHFAVSVARKHLNHQSWKLISKIECNFYIQLHSVYYGNYYGSSRYSLPASNRFAWEKLLQRRRWHAKYPPASQFSLFFVPINVNFS